MPLKPSKKIDRDRAIEEITRKFEKDKLNEKRSRMLLKTLISLGADFGKISLKDAQNSRRRLYRRDGADIG